MNGFINLHDVGTSIPIIIPIIGGASSLLCILFGVVSDLSVWGAQSTILLSIATSAIGSISIFYTSNLLITISYIFLIVSTTLTLSVWFSFLSAGLCQTRIGLSVFLSGLCVGLLLLPGVLLLNLYITNVHIIHYVRIGLFAVVLLLMFYPIVSFLKLCSAKSYQTV